MPSKWLPPWAPLQSVLGLEGAQAFRPGDGHAGGCCPPPWWAGLIVVLARRASLAHFGDALAPASCAAELVVERNAACWRRSPSMPTEEVNGGGLPAFLATGGPMGRSESMALGRCGGGGLAAFQCE